MEKHAYTDKQLLLQLFSIAEQLHQPEILTRIRMEKIKAVTFKKALSLIQPTVNMTTNQLTGIVLAMTAVGGSVFDRIPTFLNGTKYDERVKVLKLFDAKATALYSL